MSNEIFKRILSSFILIPLVIFLIIKGTYYFYISLIIIFLISSYEWLNLSKNRYYHLYGYLFLLFSMYCIYQLRFAFGNNFKPLLFVTAICVQTDIGGYFFGKIFKGPKLIKYSPNKTYSGLIGSFLFSLFVVPVSIYFDLFINDQIFEIILFTLFVSGFSQFGDILISYFKRVSNVKDTGKLIPGHGGLLDRIDGMIFAYPIAYLLLFINFLKI